MALEGPFSIPYRGIKATEDPKTHDNTWHKRVNRSYLAHVSQNYCSDVSEEKSKFLGNDYIFEQMRCSVLAVHIIRPVSMTKVRKYETNFPPVLRIFDVSRWVRTRYQLLSASIETLHQTLLQYMPLREVAVFCNMYDMHI